LRGKEYHEDRVIGASGQRVIGRAKPKALHTLFSGGNRGSFEGLVGRRANLTPDDTEELIWTDLERRQPPNHENTSDDRR
jgi:hypothetical protein